MSSVRDPVCRWSARRQQLPVLLAATVALLLGPLACGSEPVGSVDASSTTSTSPNVYLRERSAGVQNMLDTLTSALRSGDRRSLDGVLDASADPRLRAQLHVDADNLSGKRPTPPVAPSSATASSRASTSAPRTVPGERGRANVSPSGAPSAPSSPEATGLAPAPPPATDADRGGALRLKAFRYQVTPTEQAETPVPPTVQSRLDGEESSDSWVAPVDLRYALGGGRAPGLDEPEVVVSSQLVVARYGDDWKLVGYGPSDSDGAPPPQLWDYPGVAARDVPTSGGTSTVLSYPDTAETVRRVAGLLPGSIDAVTSFWGQGWARRAAVEVTSAPEVFGALARSQGTTADAAAAAVYAHLDPGAKTATGQRVLLAPTAADLPVPTLAEVMRHELTHIATRADTAPAAPAWITEGVAEYVGRKGTYVRLADAAPDLASEVTARHLPDGPPADADFAVDGPRSALAYETAWSLAAFVADKYGEARLRSLYRSVAAVGPQRQDAAISAGLGIDRARLVGQWRSWLTDQVR